MATSHNPPRGLQITTLGTVTLEMWSGANLHYDYCRIRWHYLVMLCRYKIWWDALRHQKRWVKYKLWFGRLCAWWEDQKIKPTLPDWGGLWPFNTALWVCDWPIKSFNRMTSKRFNLRPTRINALHVMRSIQAEHCKRPQASRAGMTLQAPGHKFRRQSSCNRYLATLLASFAK